MCGLKIKSEVCHSFMCILYVIFFYIINNASLGRKNQSFFFWGVYLHLMTLYLYYMLVFDVFTVGNTVCFVCVLILLIHPFVSVGDFS